MMHSMTLSRLKWLAILAPILFLATLEVVRHVVAPEFFQAWPGYLLLAGLVLLGTLFFAEAIFSVINRLQARLQRQNLELLDLHGASLGILGERDLATVLQLVVDRARDLVGAEYGALSLVRDRGGIEAFLVSGISPEQRALLGSPPEGHGILGVVLNEGATLRLDDLTRDSRSTGFPEHHPPMRSLLAVPVISQGDVLGNLYLTEKEGGAAFDAEDEESLQRFATLAALAIENARLHRQLQAMAVTEERERIAREMHDSLAQVLGYVNTKAQATEALLESGQTGRAVVQLAQLSAASREAYADVREAILGLRTSLGEGRDFVETLQEYLQLWQEQSGVAVSLQIEPAAGFAPALEPHAEVQLLRIVQEALTNVRKHASATRAIVSITRQDRALMIGIEDDGVGFDPEALGRAEVPRFGLATMRERAEAIGGTLSIAAVPGAGTMVLVRMPAEPGPGREEPIRARSDR